jgi:hypothetical protein
VPRIRARADKLRRRDDIVPVVEQPVHVSGERRGVSVACYVFVAVMWLVPDRRIERYIAAQHAAD